MDKKEILKVEHTLQKLFRQRKICVDKIVVFGSYARGKERRSSDIDIIVVSENFREKDIFERVELTSGIHRELVKQLRKPVDIMYYSDREWDKGYSLIINVAKEEGRVISG